MVFSSATYDEEEVSRIAQTLGVFHILPKPCEPEEIIRVVKAVLGQQRRCQPLGEREFDREHLRVLNAKLVQKISELEAEHEQNKLHEQLRQAAAADSRVVDAAGDAAGNRAGRVRLRGPGFPVRAG